MDVLVHVGAPVREVALHGKRYTLPAFSPSAPSPPLPPANLPCVHFHPRSSSPASPSPPASRHSSFLPPARTFAIGLWYQPASTYTAYSNEPEDCPMYLGRLTGFSKLKRGARVADPPKPTDPRTHDRGLWTLLFLFCVLTPIHPRSRVFFIFVNARFVIVSARARISSFGPASVPARLTLVSRRLHENREGAARWKAQCERRS